MYKPYKTVLDYLTAALLLPVLLPLMTIIAMVSLVVFRGNIIFEQDRMGRNGHPFTLFKFRSMNERCNKRGELLSDELRLNPWGSFLRRSSLDELPQLFNVLKGDLSIVGPRPLPIKYLEYLSHGEHSRHLIKPGITGLAQIKGRNKLNWDTKFSWDLHYVSNCSLLLDLKILWTTAILVVTMPKEVKAQDLITFKNSISRNNSQSASGANLIGVNFEN